MPGDVDGAALLDVEFEEDEEAEFAPNNVKSSAADKPPKAFNAESMPHLHPPGGLASSRGSSVA